jgi:AMMECR1 domain-containing protein
MIPASPPSHWVNSRACFWRSRFFRRQSKYGPSKSKLAGTGSLFRKVQRMRLLLPQVAVNWKWDQRRFPEETCLKAGLDRNAWLDGARVEAFTAQVFGEAEIQVDSHEQPLFKKPV